MKNHSFNGIFFIFLLFFLYLFILPCVLVLINTSKNVNFSFDKIDFSMLTNSLFAIILFILQIKLKPLNLEKRNLYLSCFDGIYFFCILFFIRLLISSITILIQSPTTALIEIEKPEKLINWIYSIIFFLLASSREEILYRFLLPQFLLNYFNKEDKKRNRIIIEIICALIFAFPHLYLGFLSVVNAFLSYFVLRFLYLKTKRLSVCILVHFVYNFINLIIC